MIILCSAMYIIHRPLKIFTPMEYARSAYIIHRSLKILIPMQDNLSTMCILHKPLQFPHKRCSS